MGMHLYKLYFVMAAANTKHTNIQKNKNERKNIHATINVKKNKEKKHNIQQPAIVTRDSIYAIARIYL